MVKALVVDTNVLLQNPDNLYSFGTDEVVIPIVVVKEIDSKKSGFETVNVNARCISRRLDDLRREGSLLEGVPLKNGGRLRVALHNQEVLGQVVQQLGNDQHMINDVRILSVAAALKAENYLGGKVVFVSNDLNARILAESLGIAAESADGVEGVTTLFEGIQTIETSSDRIDKFYADRSLALDTELFFNEGVILKANDGTNKSALGYIDPKSGLLVPLLKEASGAVQTITARNTEQRFAMNHLLRSEVELLTITGEAGTGKTLLTLAASLAAVQAKKHSEILVTRALVPVGREMGYLPGNVSEKVSPWLRGFLDSLDYICGSKDPKVKVDSKKYMAYLDDLIHFEPMAYIRGRSLAGRIVVVDEAQNLTQLEVKTLVTRAGEGTRFILLGDIEQIDNPKLNFLSNGLSAAVESFKDSYRSAHVHLVQGERSGLAAEAAKRL